MLLRQVEPRPQDPKMFSPEVLQLQREAKLKLPLKLEKLKKERELKQDKSQTKGPKQLMQKRQSQN